METLEALRGTSSSHGAEDQRDQTDNDNIAGQYDELGFNFFQNLDMI